MQIRIPILASAMVLSGLAFAQDEPTFDRSAEKTLVEMVQSFQTLKGFHALVWQGSSAGTGKPYLYSGTQELWFGGGTKFRIQTVNHFGNGYRAVCDGKKYLNDPQVEAPQAKVTVGDAKPAVSELDSVFEFGRSSGNPLLCFMGKSTFMEKVIAKDTFIVEVPGSDGLKTISFGTMSAGVVTFSYAPLDPFKLIRRVEWDNDLGWKSVLKDGKKFAPLGARRTRFDIYYDHVNQKPDDKIFDPTPPKGFGVNKPGSRQPERLSEEERERQERESGENG